MMKTIRALLLGLLMLEGVNAAAWHPRPRPRLPRIPWETVVAGGAAAGTVIAAYKISDGLEAGLKTAAQNDPQAFIEHIAAIPQTFSVGLLLSLIGAGAILYFRYRNKDKSKEEPKC